MLNVDSLVFLFAADDRRLPELAAAAELAYDTGLFEFAFEFLQSFLDVFTFFNLYDNHNLLHLLFLGTAKISKFF